MIIQREILSSLLSDMQKPSISVIIGARQTGKTVLLREIEKQTKNDSLYLDLENPFHLEILDDGYKSLVQHIKKDEFVLFVDEFQYYRNITSIFKALHDLSPGIKIYASGSSSLEIHKHLKQSLAGRLKKTIIYPLTFREWLSKYNVQLPGGIDNLPGVKELEKINRLLPDFQLFGALPGVTHFEDELDKREYLEGIFQTYIQKDVKTFLKDESIIDFNKVLKLIAFSTGQQLNLNKLAAKTGVSIRQIKKQVDILAATFVIHLLPPYFNNRRKEISKMPKVFFYDTGVLHAIKRDFRPMALKEDRGAIFETMIFHEIIKSMTVMHDLFYWRTADQNEVDFILVKDRCPLPIEVKMNIEKGKIPNGLKNFLKMYPKVKRAVIMTENLHFKIKQNDVEIFYLPFYMAGNLVHSFF